MTMARIGILGLAAIAALAFACSRTPAPAPQATLDGFSTVRWDGAPDSAKWTKASFQALDGHGAALVNMGPDDIDAYCPAYPDLDASERKLFWTNLIASLSYHESTWKQDAAGGGGKWYGLLQILPATAKGYQCQAQTKEDLKDGVQNISCALRIMAVTVPRDGVVSRDFKGIAADWGPFHQERKREDIQSYSRALPICRG